ncbi:MAG: sugar transferase [Oscillospiraceae bacterium]|nr:sugar transferase [Oscillospiraceae bacterium]
MLHKLRRSILLLWKLLVFLAIGAVFFLLYSIRNPYLLAPSRTAGITVLAFTLAYFAMTRVYGGFDVGTRKSRPIVYSLGLTAFASDLIAHLFLCIMNTTVIHHGRFVYEQPLLLLAVMALQFLLLSLLTYGGNGLYFQFVSPQRCLVVMRPGDDVRRLTSKIASFHKQFRIERMVTLDQPGLYSLIDEYDAIFVCNLSLQERISIVDYCYSQKKEFYYTLEMNDIVSLGAHRVMFDDTSMMHSTVKGLTMEQRIIKRCGDLLLSLIALILTSPIFLVTAIAIKLEDGGHVFYRQKRATYGGRTFNVLKFRSMREENSIHRSVIKDDDRITKVGRVIRKYRIDELPQFVNVLKSDMSFVGPRPEMLENVEKYTQELPEFSYRLWAKAGLTGMAQVYGKYNTSPKEKLVMDMIYIEQYSLLLDLKLMLRTVLVLFTPEESTEAFEEETEAAAHS